MSCSTMATVTPKSATMSSIQNVRSSVSSGFKPRRRLVEQQQARFRTQRPPDFHHLSSAVGKIAHGLPAMALQVQQIDHRFHPFPKRDLLPAHGQQEQHVGQKIGAAMHMAADKQIVQHRLAVEQLRVLERPSDTQLGDPMRGPAGHVFAGEAHAAGIGVVEAADDVEDGRLAGAVRPDDAEHLAFDDIERHVAHGLHAAETQRQVARLEQRRQWTRSVRR